MIDPNTIKAIYDVANTVAAHYARLIGPVFTMPIDARTDAKLSSSMPALAVGAFWSEEEAKRKQDDESRRETG